VIIINNDKERGIQPVALAGGLLAIFAQAYLWGNVFVTLFKPQRRPSEATAPGPGNSNPLDRPVAPEQVAPEARRLPPDPHQMVPDSEVASAPRSSPDTSTVDPLGPIARSPNNVERTADSSASSSPTTQPAPRAADGRFSGASGQLRSQRTAAA
jgi:hypothetical protein